MSLAKKFVGHMNTLRPEGADLDFVAMLKLCQWAEGGMI